MARVVLVMGFGPFLTVSDNPATRLAQKIDGMTRPGLRVVGRVMPVSFTRAISKTLQCVSEVAPDVLIGVGVAQRRSVITIEAVGRNHADPGLADVDGQTRNRLCEAGARSLSVTMPTDPLASCLSAVVGHDAGQYVCNAWIYEIVRALGADLPIGFIHIPPAGLQASRLADALAETEGSTHGTQQKPD